MELAIGSMGQHINSSIMHLKAGKLSTKEAKKILFKLVNILGFVDHVVFVTATPPVGIYYVRRQDFPLPSESSIIEFMK